MDTETDLDNALIKLNQDKKLRDGIMDRLAKIRDAIETQNPQNIHLGVIIGRSDPNVTKFFVHHKFPFADHEIKWLFSDDQSTTIPDDHKGPMHVSKAFMWLRASQSTLHAMSWDILLLEEKVTRMRDVKLSVIVERHLIPSQRREIETFIEHIPI